MNRLSRKLPAALLICSALALMFGAGCKPNQLLDRSLIFSTHTVAGVEASINPTQAGTAPITTVIGYRRFEGVMNPVYFNPLAYNTDRFPNYSEMDEIVDHVYRDKAFSVLATFDGNGSASAKGGGGNGEVAAAIMQIFATGDAANILARTPEAIRQLSVPTLEAPDGARSGEHEESGTNSSTQPQAAALSPEIIRLTRWVQAGADEDEREERIQALEAAVLEVEAGLDRKEQANILLAYPAEKAELVIRNLEANNNTIPNSD